MVDRLSFSGASHTLPQMIMEDVAAMIDDRGSMRFRCHRLLGCHFAVRRMEDFTPLPHRLGSPLPSLLGMGAAMSHGEGRPGEQAVLGFPRAAEELRALTEVAPQPRRTRRTQALVFPGTYQLMVRRCDGPQGSWDFGDQDGGGRLWPTGRRPPGSPPKPSLDSPETTCAT
jgi:hypothetical protein